VNERIRVQLNGEPRDLPGPMSVRELLTVLDLDPRMVAVELDRVVVKRDRYAETRIEAGAEIEIVGFVGGGHIAGIEK